VPQGSNIDRLHFTLVPVKKRVLMYADDVKLYNELAQNLALPIVLLVVVVGIYCNELMLLVCSLRDSCG